MLGYRGIFGTSHGNALIIISHHAASCAVYLGVVDIYVALLAAAHTDSVSYRLTTPGVTSALALAFL